MLGFFLKVLGFLTRISVKIPLMFGVSEDTIYILTSRLIGWILSLRIDLEVIGMENMPDSGPILIIFNHTDGLDAFIMPPGMLPLVMYGWVADNHIDIPFVTVYHAIDRAYPVKRGKKDKGAMEWIVNALLSGNIATLAPEGTRNVFGVLRPKEKIKWGTAYIAAKTGAVVVPVGINGTTHGIKRLINPFESRFKVSIVIGEPFELEDHDELLKRDLSEKGVKDAWQEIVVNEFMPRIAALLEPWMGGEFS
jgi:1-acyl-sn-glycerol-3-phosphate acyltransferase